MTKILIIDNHKSWLTVLKSILVQSGFEVDVASTGQEGLELLTKNKPDVLLLDLMMPFMSGYEILEKLQESETLNDIPTIVVSARSHTRDQKLAYEFGATDYLVKPVHPNTLIKRIQELVP